MPQHKSCKKRLKTSDKARVRNRGYRSSMRNAIKAVTDAKSFDEATSALKVAISELDRSAGKSLVHKNMAARKKSRLCAHVASLRSQG